MSPIRPTPPDHVPFTVLTFIPRNSIKPVTLKVSHAATIEVGRARPGEVHGMLSHEDGLRMSFDIPSLSEQHAQISIRDGGVYVTDLHSRNKTMLCVPPNTERPVDGAAVWFGPDLALHVNDVGWELPAAPDRMSREDLLAWLGGRLSARGLAVELSNSSPEGLPLSDGQFRLVLRSLSQGSTIDAHATTWTQAAVSTWNASQHRSVGRPWRFASASPERMRTRRLAERLAPTHLPVLLVGPALSGRHVLAQDLHDHGPTPDGPFVAFRVNAVPRADLDASLFGGEIQGATVRGAAEQAVGGTLYLDEVSQLPPAAQVKLLHLVERDRRVRVIAATVHDLRGRAEGFREDLYWRLAALRIDVPAHATDDLAAVARDTLQRTCTSQQEVPDALLDALAQRAASHPWRHGAREMSETLERLASRRRLDSTWLAEWDALVPSQRPVQPPPLPRQLPLSPTALGRMLADVLFLRAAEETPQRALLARRLQMTYQGADARAIALDLELDNPQQVIERRKDRESELRRVLHESPELRGMLRELLDA